MNKILCVEDARDVQVILEATLQTYHLVFAASVREAMDILECEKFSLVILDICLPDGSGLEVMASMPHKLVGTPVIFLTGKKDFASKVSAFSLGADDFIVKPFNPSELRLRVDSKIRKLTEAKDQSHILRIGSLVCNLQEQRLFKNTDRDPVDLTSLEFRIFHLLAKTPNKIFSREEILDRVWGNGVAVTDRAVDVHISNVRKKLGGTDVSIEAVIGSGYRILVESRPAFTKT